MSRSSGIASYSSLFDATLITGAMGKPTGVPRPVVEAVLKADAAKLPAVLGVDLGDQGYAVARLAKVEAPDPASEQMKALQPRYAQAWANAEKQAYLDALKRRFKVEVKVQPAAPKAEAPEAAASR